MDFQLQLILGGARSGKSRYALNQGDEASHEPKLFLATATAQDGEMDRRIKLHQSERGPQWRTLEEPYEVLKVLRDCRPGPQGLVVMDCATLWISNLLCGVGGKKLSSPDIEKLFEDFFHVLPKLTGQFRIISNEVGLGIVPETPLGREFRDLQGRFNQSAAAIAGQVVLMVAGIPQKIK